MELPEDDGGDLDGVTGAWDVAYRGEIFGLSSSFCISCSNLSSSDFSTEALEPCKTSTVKVLSFSFFFLDLNESRSIVRWNNEVFSFFLNTFILSLLLSFSSILSLFGQVITSLPLMTSSISTLGLSVISSTVRSSLLQF